MRYKCPTNKHSSRIPEEHSPTTVKSNKTSRSKRSAKQLSNKFKARPFKRHPPFMTMKSTKMLTCPDEPELETDKRSKSRDGSNIKQSSKKPNNLDLSIQFQNGSFSLDTVGDNETQTQSAARFPIYQVNEETSNPHSAMTTKSRIDAESVYSQNVIKVSEPFSVQ